MEKNYSITIDHRLVATTYSNHQLASIRVHTFMIKTQASEQNGLEVKKEYYNINGSPIDIKSVKQGDQIVVSLIVNNKTKEKSKH